ncbi:MAG: helix-turn-helix transcriptional regulator [Bacilli bacterium]|nr:helix-turn-helix transcriptional regulator [Bacilli bacterium]
MDGYTYNRKLYTLRLDKGLSRKELSKELHISRFFLFLFERGYFRPRGKIKNKLESYFGITLDYKKENGYPSRLVDENQEKNRGFAGKKRFLISGILTAFMAILLVTGSIMFDRSTKNDASFYGESYASLYQKSRVSGKVGTEIATNASYHYFDSTDRDAFILFYDSSSFLHFNECIYAAYVIFYENPEIGNVRLHYRFGGDLASDSYRCYFTCGSTTYGSVVTCEALYHGQEVTKLENIQVRVSGAKVFDEATLLMLLNFDLSFAVHTFDDILKANLGENVDFLNVFLKDREQGRSVAMGIQIAGLSLLFAGVIGLFVGLSLLIYSLLRKLRLPIASPIRKDEEKELPDNKVILVGIPEFILLTLLRIISIVCFLLILVSFLGKVGVSLPSIFYDGAFLLFLQTSFMAMPFVRLILISRSSNDGKTILSEMARNFLIFFFLAGFETFLIAITNTWGYDFTDLIYDFIPGSVFQVITLLYLIVFFLNFTPRFLESKSIRARAIWRLLSLIPLALLIGSVLLSNAHLLFYGVSKNIFISFWFPASIFPAILISLLAIYGLFFLRLFFQNRYGSKSDYYLNGNLYGLLSNLLMVIPHLLVYSLFLILNGNGYAYYLGFVNGGWVLTLIPFFLLCKPTPRPIEELRIESSIAAKNE